MAKEAILNTASGGSCQPVNAARRYPGLMGEDFSETVGDYFSEPGGNNISEWMGDFPGESTPLRERARTVHEHEEEIIHVCSS
jgi:hypothetical protein